MVVYAMKMEKYEFFCGYAKHLHPELQKEIIIGNSSDSLKAEKDIDNYLKKKTVSITIRLYNTKRTNKSKESKEETR